MIKNIINCSNITDNCRNIPINCNNIHFIGIGGISMSGIAKILKINENLNITGSDIKESRITNELVKNGIKVYYGHNASNITNNLDLVVYTAAIDCKNEEIVRAKELNIKTMERAEFLGYLMQGFLYPICVAGTHGKTTTSSMLSEIFIEANLNPTITLGGILPSLDSNIRVGSNEYFILEACEYCDSFLKFKPHSAIILNIDEDHLDYFRNLEHIYDSFEEFAKLIDSLGCLVVNSDIKDFSKITKNLDCNIITYGKSLNADWTAKDIHFNSEGLPSYTAFYKNKEFAKITLNVFGMHNIYNSLATCALANFYGIKKSKIQKGLLNFKGTKRRFQLKGYFNGVRVVDDYAHHPTEILATIDSAKRQKFNKLWCVFQPHTFTRTKALLEKFAQSLMDVDEVVILDIYAAREKDKKEVHSKDLVEKINHFGGNAIYMQNFEEAKEYLSTNCSQDDMLITMGAGDVYLLGEMLLK